MFKDKTHLQTSPSGIFSRVLCISERMRDSLLDSRGCSREASFVFEQSGAPFPARGLIILVTKRPELSAKKLRVRIKDNKNSPHGKFHRFLFPFSSKFSDLNFASYVVYNLLVLCHVSHTVSLGYLCRDLRVITVRHRILGVYLLS